MENLEKEVQEHKLRYPTFNDVDFLDWYYNRDDTWKETHKGFSVPQLNKLRRIHKDISSIADSLTKQFSAVLQKIDSL
jgi:hypothetical protein